MAVFLSCNDNFIVRQGGASKPLAIDPFERPGHGLESDIAVADRQVLIQPTVVVRNMQVANPGAETMNKDFGYVPHIYTFEEPQSSQSISIRQTASNGIIGTKLLRSRGAVANAPAGSRGTTLAVHSTLGFGAAFLGPLAVGMVLDLLQGNPDLAWGMAFVCMDAGCALGPLALRLQRK